MRLLVMLFLISPVCCIAQKGDTVLRYLDEHLQLTSKNNAAFYGLSIRQGDHWLLYAVYSDKTPAVKIYFKDKNLKVKDGPFEVYYPQNLPAQKGYFTDNVMNGNWITWYENGVMKDSGSLNNNVMTGLWKSWSDKGILHEVVTYKAELNKIDKYVSQADQGKSNMYRGVKDGDYSSYYQNGIKESSGHYISDKQDGEWQWYYENGKLSTKEQYKEGKLSAMTCYDSSGKETGDYCSIQKPALLKGFGDYKQFIMQNLEWPKAALRKGLEGEVRLKIKVNKEGKLESLVIESEELLFKQAVKQLFDKMGDWEPAVSHNRVVEWEDEMVVPFYMERR